MEDWKVEHNEKQFKKRIEDLEHKLAVAKSALEQIERDGHHFVSTSIGRFGHPLHVARQAIKEIGE